MAREVRPDEISNILKQQLQQFEQEVDVYDSGTVLEVGDGIARGAWTCQCDGKRNDRIP